MHADVIHGRRTSHFHYLCSNTFESIATHGFARAHVCFCVRVRTVTMSRDSLYI